MSWLPAWLRLKRPGVSWAWRLNLGDGSYERCPRCRVYRKSHDGEDHKFVEKEDKK